MQDGHTTLAVEAALCLWEAMLETRDDDKELQAAFDALGTFHMRHTAIALAPVVLGVWDALSETEREAFVPYDWEFVPAVLGLVNWDHDVIWSGPHTTDVPGTVARIARALKARAGA